MTPDSELRRFAWYVAGPRDFVINLVINGVIAWFVFSREEATPLAGADSLFKMLLPMSAIESTLTSFFGLLNGTQELRKRAAPPKIIWRRWMAFAIVDSLIQGMLGLAVFVLARFATGWLFPTTMLPPRLVPVIVGVISGCLAYVLHSRAVMKAQALCAKTAFK